MLSLSLAGVFRLKRENSQQAQNQNVHVGAGLKRQDDTAGREKVLLSYAFVTQYGMCPDPVSYSLGGWGNAYFHGKTVTVS